MKNRWPCNCLGTISTRDKRWDTILVIPPPRRIAPNYMLDSLLFNPNPASLMRHQPRVVDECERIMRNCYLNCNNVVLRGGV